MVLRRIIYLCQFFLNKAVCVITFSYLFITHKQQWDRFKQLDNDFSQFYF